MGQTLISSPVARNSAAPKTRTATFENKLPVTGVAGRWAGTGRTGAARAVVWRWSRAEEHSAWTNFQARFLLLLSKLLLLLPISLLVPVHRVFAHCFQPRLAFDPPLFSIRTSRTHATPTSHTYATPTPLSTPVPVLHLPSTPLSACTVPTL